MLIVVNNSTICTSIISSRRIYVIRFVLLLLLFILHAPISHIFSILISLPTSCIFHLVCVCGLSMAQFSFWKRKTFWMVSVTSVRYVTMAAYQTAQWPLKWHDARTDDGWSSVRSAGRVIFSYIFFFGVCACIVWLYATVIIMWCWHQLRLHRLCTIEYIIFECRSHNNSIWNSYAPAQRDREGGGGREIERRQHCQEHAFHGW